MLGSQTLVKNNTLFPLYFIFVFERKNNFFFLFFRQNKLEEYNEGFLDRFNRNVRKLYRIRSKVGILF